LIIKDLYLLAALDTENHKYLVKSGRYHASGDDEDLKVDRSVEHAWKGVFAYHFLILAQQLYYAGSFKGAMRCALKLLDYDDIIPKQTIYSLIALTSYHAQYLGVCSKIFIKLELLDPQVYQPLAGRIFSSKQPLNPKNSVISCQSCGSSMSDSEFKCSTCEQKYNISAMTGDLLIDAFYSCSTCKQEYRSEELSELMQCLVCKRPLE
jgi:WD repeat-containing protein 35